MAHVVFVGDEPSLLNVDESIPFVGSRSFKMLTEWIAILAPDYYICYNSSTPADIVFIKALYKYGFKIVTLGAKAATRMQDAGLKCVSLPHPSPKNRILNDKKKVKEMLNNAKVFIETTDKVNTWRQEWKKINKI